MAEDGLGPEVAHQAHQRGRGADGVPVGPDVRRYGDPVQGLQELRYLLRSYYSFVRVVIGPYLPESGFYPGRAFHDRVRLEVQPGRALEARLGPDGALDAPGRALQSLVGRLGVLPGEHAVEDRGVGEVGAHPDAGNRHEALDARVGERGDLFARDLLQLRLYLAGASAHGFASQSFTNSSRQSRIDSSS